EAEAESYLGDLLLHSGDISGASKRLEQALALDPDQPMANSSLGLVRVRQGKFAEARPLLKKAVAANSQNYMTHFNYAYALSQEGMGANNMVSGYTAEAAEEMRTELRKAIELAPTFPESYHLLAFVNLVRNEQIDESIALMKRGLALSPGREEFSLMLAQLYLRKQDFKGARELLEPMVRSSSSDKQLRAHAQMLLDSIAKYEEQVADLKKRQDETADDAGGSDSVSEATQAPRLKRRGDATTQAEESAAEEPVAETENRLPIRRPEAGEEQARGLLLRIECDPKGATFIIKVGDQTLRLRTTNFSGIQFTTYTPDISGDITCGARNPANPVVVTFRPSKETRAKFNGDLVAVDFVPKDFELRK
ncbi:MAG: tetratricopeptide repeat protein, partial [Acidobacteriota bacterium]|nr:tetratricopeptide repeat protein [Acidobacteriota bacterium]